MDKNIETTPLSHAALKQYINAKQVFSALSQAYALTKKYEGFVFWHTVKGKMYLVKTTKTGTQTSLGVKSPQTEQLYMQLTSQKKEALSFLKELQTSHLLQQRLNRALFVGRVDPIIIAVLQQLAKAGIAKHFTVIGTNALSAYESAAGVRLHENCLATNDLDLLWDNRKKLVLTGIDQPKSLLAVLQKADPTFRIRRDQIFTAINDSGYEIDLLRRIGNENDLKRPSNDEDDFWAVKAKNADWLLSAPKFSEMVIGTNGAMAEMTTVDPRAFVLFKQWMATQADRDPRKKARDLLQAAAVTKLLNEYFPQLSFDDIHVFPEKITIPTL